MSPTRVDAKPGRRRRSGRSRDRVARTMAGVLLCTVLTACGGTDDVQVLSSPSTQPPATPPPEPTSGGRLHVLQHPFVLTYEIDGPTGHLREPATQNLGEARLLAGDPQGRFVYAAHGGWDSPPFPNGADLTLATYAPDPGDGTLDEVSATLVAGLPEQHQLPVGWGDRGQWLWLVAGATRLHGLWVHNWGTAGRHSTYVYVNVSVGSDGGLGPAQLREFTFDADPGKMTVDVGSDMLYKAATQPWTPDTVDKPGGLTAYSIGQDGQLRGTGWSNLCLGRILLPDEVPTPLAATGDFLFASVPLDADGSSSVCSYRGQRLKTWDDLGFQASVAAAFAQPSPSEPALLAMNVQTPTGRRTVSQELRLFSMDAEGDLQALSSEVLLNPVAQVLFHPSGRFLYLSDSEQRLRAYAIDTSGGLQLLDDVDHAGGSMAVSLEKPQTSDR